MDDPREILKAAGVECAEVDAFEENKLRWRQHYYVDQTTVYNKADKTILALARLVAKYKWQLGRVLADEVGVFEGGTDEWGNVVPDDSRELADLERRWKEHNA